MLKPAAAFLPKNAGATGAGIVSGNLVATRTLAALGVITAVLVAAIIVWPLAHVGRPALPRGVFGTSIAYFALIGFGFMFVQIAFLQRFSVYLGHPTYTFSIVLFLMILSAGARQLRVGADRPGQPPGTARDSAGDRRPRLRGRAAAAGGPRPQRRLAAPRPDGRGRCLVTPLAFLMGHCFPLVFASSVSIRDEIAAWMWGVNGACGVMGSIAAVMISMWISIDGGLLLAGSLYLLLLLPMRVLLSATRDLVSGAGLPAASEGVRQ